MTIEEVKMMCEKIAKDFNYTINFPIVANKRMTSTLGMVKSLKDEEGRLHVTEMDFSYHFLQWGTEEQLNDTIRHELAHVFTITETGEGHGHDAVWKAWAIKLGATPKAYATNQNVYKKGEAGTSPYKYELYCSKCGKFLDGYHRTCKTVKEIDNYTSRCCDAPIKCIRKR